MAGRILSVGRRLRRVRAETVSTASGLDDRAAAPRENEARFASAFEAAPIGMVLIHIDRSPPAVWSNRVFRSMLGYEDDELLRTPPQDFIVSEDLPQALEDMRRLFAGEVESYRTERRVRHKDGHWLWVEISVSLGRDDSGIPRYLISQLQDVSVRKNAEEALRESEERYRVLAEALFRKTAELEAVFEAVPDMFFHADAQGTILAYHGSSRAQLFASPETFIGQSIHSVLPEQAAALIGSTVAAVCRTGHPRTVECALQMLAEWRTYEARVWPLQPGEAIAIVRDITDTRQRQEQLAHLLRVATMSEMAATLAHEVHQPLQAIINFAKGCVERLQRGTVHAAELRAPLDCIAAEAMRAGEVVRRMREFVRTRQPQRETVNPNDLVIATVRLAEPEAMRASVEMELELAANLPPVSVDRVQVQQVVLNLIRNSFDALASTAPAARRLTISTAALGEFVRIAVRDTGPGLSPEVAGRIFTPLFTTKPSGLGMGLAISRSIAEAHGGQVRAVSGPGPGALFEVILPIAAAAAAGRHTRVE